MLKHTYLFFVALAIAVHSLHLHQETIQHLVSSSQLNAILQTDISELTALNKSIEQTLTSLNPYSQAERISSLQSAVVAARKKLIRLHSSSAVPLNNQQYYCQPIPATLSNNLRNSIDAVNSNALQLGQIAAVNNPNISINGMPNSITSATKDLTNSINSPGTIVSNPPQEINQPNLLAPNWILGNTSISDLAAQSQLGNGQNGNSCPLSTPFVNQLNQCINCPNFYNAQTKSCYDCQQYDQTKHVCNGVSSPTATNGPTGSNTTNTTNTINTTNNIANPTPIMRVTNSNNLAGLLLPPNVSIQDYKQSLLANPQNQNLLPCPSGTPFFDGTACISCPANQYFSSLAKVCQTCPFQQVYNAQTYHCEAISYYSNPEVKLWTSISTPPADILKNITNAAAQPNAKPCPIDIPYFNGQACIACPNPTPIFSYDGLKCTSCLQPTVFDANIFSCATAQKMQTNPATADNLIMEGRSLNEWKTYYFNNQTADPQIADCPSSKPFFDSITCIACPPDTPYFNLQYRICQVCPKQTAYDKAVRECLSTAGNIVTQSPNILKMAAGIFA